VPADGKIPLTLMKQLTDQPGMSKVIGYSLYLLFIAGVSSLLVLSPSTAPPLHTPLAWVNILVIPLIIATAFIGFTQSEGFSARMMFRVPMVTLYPPIWFAAASGLFGYGLATLLGKMHEHQGS
jgi:hypothetical protein